MAFSDKYISDKENKIKPDQKKMVLSDDAFAVGDMIENLILTIKNLMAVIK